MKVSRIRPTISLAVLALAAIAVLALINEVQEVTGTAVGGIIALSGKIIESEEADHRQGNSGVSP
jgi:hypothetical protein